MAYLVIKDLFNQAYELTDRASAPRSSSALRYRSDAYSTFRFVARLPVTPAHWVQILKSTQQHLPHFHSNHPGEVYQAVAQAVMRGDLTIYQLPALSANGCLQGKKGFGLCLIQGPSPHSATNLTPEAIASPAAAQQLLDNLGISPQALVGYLTHQNLYNSYQKQNPLADALQLLASGQLLAYKITLPPKAPPAKATEYLPPSAADKPVPLAPESSARSAATTSPTAKEEVPPVNPELEARAQELGEIGQQLRTEGYVPSTDEEISSAVASGDLGNPRYLVSIQKSKSANEPIGYRRPDTGRTTMWTTTYDMLKKGDLSAPLLMSLLGSTYEPAAEYTMYIFDQGENFEQDGALTFSPTWENMQKYCPEELHMDDPEDPVHDKALLSSVMNPDTQVKYQQTMESFWADTKGTNKSEYSERDVEEYLANKGFSVEERAEFRARHLYRTQIGANAYFLGTGATEFTLHDKNKAAINNDGISIKGEPGKLGVPEMLTIEKNPPSIAALEKQGSLKSIPLKKVNV